MLRRLLHLTIAVVVGSLLWTAAPASAVENPDYTAPPPVTAVSTPTPTTAPKVKTAVAVTPVRTRLAITGSDATGTVVLGIGLVAAGAGILVIRRRKLAAL